MCNSTKISVILPVYNVESYIGKCLGSLRSQTLEDLEFIFVDDRTPDGSIRIVESEAKKDPRIRIITNEENMGPGPSRNRGIEVARGEYLSFVDPDDYLAPDFYEILYRSAEENDADIAKGHCAAVDEEGNADGSWWSTEKKLKSDLEKGAPLFCCFRNEHISVIIKKSLLKHDPGLRYGDSRVGEDTIFLLKLCRKEPKFVMDENAVYYHLIRKDSLTGSLTYKSVQNELDALNDRIEILCGEPFPEEGYSYLHDSIKYHIRRFMSVYLADEDQEGRRERYHAFYNQLNRMLAKAPRPERITGGNRLYKELLELEGSDTEISLAARIKRKIGGLTRPR